MEIQIQAKDFELTNELRTYIKQRIRLSFNWTRSNIRQVSVFVSDINGPRGGTDKRCHIKLGLKQIAAIHIEETQTNIQAAIERAVDRASHVLSKRIDKQRKHRSQTARQTYPQCKVMAPFIKPMLDELRQASMLKS